MHTIYYYAAGITLLHAGYVEVMRSNGAAQGVKVFFELIAGASYLVFGIWGLFVYPWWQVLLAPLLGVIIESTITRLIWFPLLPHLYVIAGIYLTLFSLI